MTRALPLLALALLPAAARAAGDRSLESRHQPVVIDGRAQAPACPDWSSRNNGNDEGNASNYGCATAANLAAMIADPTDLIRGRSDGHDDFETASRAVAAWRSMQPSSKQWTVTNSVSSKGGN